MNKHYRRMSAELWRVIQDLETAFVAVSCSHVSASVVELLMPQYSSDRNQALQMLEGIVGVAFHWMLGVQLFRLLVPLRYHNFPGTVFTVFAPLLLRQQYTKLLVAVQGIAGQTVRLLPSMLGDESKPRNGRTGRGGAVQPLPVDMSQWQQALDDLEASIITGLQEVLAQAQAAYVAGNKERLAQENATLKAVFSEGVSQITSLLQQGNDIAQQQLDMAVARRDTVAQWQLGEKLKAFKEAANRMAAGVAVRLTSIEGVLEQMAAALADIQYDVRGVRNGIDQWRKGGEPVVIDDDPPPVDPSDPLPQEPTEYPFTVYQDGKVLYIAGPTNNPAKVFEGAEALGLYDACGLLRRDSIDPNQVYTWNSNGTYSKWSPPPFQPGSYAGRGEEAYYNGWDVRMATSGPKKGATKDVCNVGNKCISLANPEPHDCPKDEYHTFG